MRTAWSTTPIRAGAVRGVSVLKAGAPGLLSLRPNDGSVAASHTHWCVVSGLAVVRSLPPPLGCPPHQDRCGSEGATYRQPRRGTDLKITIPGVGARDPRRFFPALTASRNCAQPRSAHATPQNSRSAAPGNGLFRRPSHMDLDRVRAGHIQPPQQPGAAFLEQSSCRDRRSALSDPSGVRPTRALSTGTLSEVAFQSKHSEKTVSLALPSANLVSGSDLAMGLRVAGACYSSKRSIVAPSPASCR